MTTRNFITLCLIIIPSFVAYAQPQILFDTDFGGDADDLAALAMLHNLHNDNECDLKAIMCWSTIQHAVPAIDAVNRFYGNPEIPIGVRKHPAYIDTNSYSVPIAEQFEHQLTHDNVPDATNLYRKILSEAEDMSITIVTVGPLYNIKALMESGPDAYSELKGIDLINKKVKEFAIMGGQFPSGKDEWNFNGGMPGVTKYVIDNISRPITFSGYEIGVKIKSGAVLNERPENTPLFQGFMHFSSHASWMKDYYKGKILDNSSYDQTAVLYAVRNETGNLWTKSERGFCIADSTGGNSWKPDPDGNHTYLKLTIDPEQVAHIIEAIMLDEE